MPHWLTFRPNPYLLRYGIKFVVMGFTLDTTCTVVPGFTYKIGVVKKLVSEARAIN